MMNVPVPTEEVFLILKRYLPQGTYMSSAYRSPEDQLRVIQGLVQQYNAEKPKDQIRLPPNLSVNSPQTWLPALQKLRTRYSVNAPVPIQQIRPSPHSAARVVFDLGHGTKTSEKLNEIKEACIVAEKRQLLGFNQIRIEPKQHAVHVDVRWVSSKALRDLWITQGFAVT